MHLAQNLFKIVTYSVTENCLSKQSTIIESLSWNAHKANVAVLAIILHHQNQLIILNLLKKDNSNYKETHVEDANCCKFQGQKKHPRVQRSLGPVLFIRLGFQAHLCKRSKLSTIESSELVMNYRNHGRRCIVCDRRFLQVKGFANHDEENYILGFLIRLYRFVFQLTIL